MMFAGGASANHLLFSFSLQLQGKRICVHYACLDQCNFACMCGVRVCAPSVLERWRVEARVCRHSEISQLSYCLCSFSIHAL